MKIENTVFWALVCGAAIAGAGCGDREKTPEASGGDEAEDSEEEEKNEDPLALKERTFEITRDQRQATIRAPLPVSWEETETGGDFRPKGEASLRPRSFSVSLGGYSCTGGCTDEDFERERDEVLESARVLGAEQMHGSDWFEVDAEDLERGEISGGGYVATRLRAPEPGDRRFFEGIRIICSRFRSGDYGHIVTRVDIPQDYEDELYPLMLESCKQAEVVSDLIED